MTDTNDPPVGDEAAGGPCAAEADGFERAISRLILLEHRLFASELERYELTPAQYRALVYVSRRVPACTMGELAEYLHQSSATTTGLVDRLVRRNLAERQSDAVDRRRVMVQVTDSGLRLLSQASQARHQRTVDILTSLDDADRQRLISLLDAYVDCIAAALVEMDH